MKDLLQSPMFVSVDQINQLRSGTTVQGTLDAVSESGHIGSIIEGERPLYIDGQRLAEGVINRTVSLEQELTYAMASDELTVFIGGTLSADSDEKDFPEGQAFAVLAGGTSVGYYFKDSEITNRATRRLIYICSRGHRAPKADAVDGRLVCIHDGSDIVSQVLE